MKIPPRLSPRQSQQLTLLGLLCFILGWDLWAVLMDQRIGGPDTFVGYTLNLRSALDEGWLRHWWRGLGPKGPVAPLLALPLLGMVGQAPLAMRLLTVLAHGVFILQCHHLGRQVWGRPAAGLWAALIASTCPLVFGLFRLAFHDVIAAVFLAALLQALLRWAPTRPIRSSLLIGLVGGLGAMVKLSFVLHALPAALWFVARHGGRLRGLAGAGVACITALAIAGVWALPNQAGIRDNILRSSHDAQHAVWDKLEYYLPLPGMAALLMGAILSAILLWRARQDLRWDLALMFCFIPMLLIMHFFPVGSRYLLPVTGPMIITAGCGLALLHERLPSSLRRVLCVLLAGALLGQFVAYNLAGRTPHSPREQSVGMLSPDPRPHRACPRAMTALLRHGPAMLVAWDSMAAMVLNEDLETIWHHRGLRPRYLDLSSARAQLARGEAVSVLLVRNHPGAPLHVAASPRFWPPVPPGEPPEMHNLQRRVRWLLDQPRRQLLYSAKNPDGLGYQAFRVEP